jgi:hypothetical protein
LKNKKIKKILKGFNRTIGGWRNKKLERVAKVEKAIFKI